MKKTGLVYCVDDEESIRALYEESLTIAGYDAMTFENAASFIAQCQQKKPDLALVDVMMKGEDGFSLLTRIRDDKTMHNLPVILVTAKSSEADAVKGLRLGANDYVRKPFGIMELLARIEANLPKTEPGAALAGDLALDERKREISINGQPLSLSKTEFDLLSYLVKNAGRVVEKEELLRNVWGIEGEVETRTLDIHVAKLRKKLQGSSSTIKTVRGVGYLLG